jgi:hypothetical protein
MRIGWAGDKKDMKCAQNSGWRAQWDETSGIS